MFYPATATATAADTVTYSVASAMTGNDAFVEQEESSIMVLLFDFML